MTEYVVVIPYELRIKVKAMDAKAAMEAAEPFVVDVHGTELELGDYCPDWFDGVIEIIGVLRRCPGVEVEEVE